MPMRDHAETEVYDDPDPQRDAEAADIERWEAFLFEIRQFAADQGWENVERAVGQAKAEDRQRG